MEKSLKITDIFSLIFIVHSVESFGIVKYPTLYCNFFLQQIAEFLWEQMLLKQSLFKVS